MRYVLDASVAIKFYVPEDQSEDALSWLARDLEFDVPDIFLVEVGQALLRHVREGRLSRDDLDLAVSDLQSVVRMTIGSGGLIERALKLSALLYHRLHDCVYLALAERLGASLPTADERLVRKVREPDLPIDVLLLTDPIS